MRNYDRDRQAFERSGQAGQTREHLERFQHITGAKLGAPVSFAYGDEGKYSLAEEMPPLPAPVPPAIPVHFVDVTALAGLPARYGPAVQPDSLANFLGSGACVIDYDGDGRPDLLLVNADGNGKAALYRNLGHGRFDEVTEKAGIKFHGEGTGCAVGDDYDNDGHPDFALGSSRGVVLYHNPGDGTFRDVKASAGIHVRGLVLGLTFIDFDHDGDLDSYVTRFGDSISWTPQQPLSFPRIAKPDGNLLWRNNGNGTFTEWTAPTGLQGVAASLSALAMRHTLRVQGWCVLFSLVDGWQSNEIQIPIPGKQVLAGVVLCRRKDSGNDKVVVDDGFRCETRFAVFPSFFFHRGDQIAHLRVVE
ncbi:MAG: VCBS repeat-containing protein [Candidatus Acidiferrales bacterium]